MANVNFIRGNTSQINNTPNVDGQLLFDTEERTMQMDNGTDRIKIGVNSSVDISYDNTVSQLEASNVQEAIDEVVDTMGSSSAKLVDYDTWKTMPQSEKDSGQLWGIVGDDEYGLNNTAESVLYGDGTVADALNNIPKTANDIEYGDGTVKDALDDKVSKNGDTMTGLLDINNLAEQTASIVSRNGKYIRSQINSDNQADIGFDDGAPVLRLKKGGTTSSIKFGVDDEAYFAFSHGAKVNILQPRTTSTNAVGLSTNRYTSCFVSGALYAGASQSDQSTYGNGYVRYDSGNWSVRSNALQSRDKENKNWMPVFASAFTQQSSRKYKENIKDMTDTEALKLLALNPVTYDYINKADGVGCMGLIAEDVAEIETYPVVKDADGNPEGIDYSKFVPQLIKLCQIQQKEIDELKELVKAVK